MQIDIDKNSGYCFGVEFAIQMAEDELNDSGKLYCLGDIVHNTMEVERLQKKGLQVIAIEQLKDLHDCKVLIRAHGEPPETYQLALQNNIELIDASCPVVLKLQNRVKNSFDTVKKQDGQVVIYGQQGHAEVIGIAGQTNNEAIVVTTEEDLAKVDFSRPVAFYSQTTKSTTGFYNMKALIEERIKAQNQPMLEEAFDANDSICRQVSNREPQLEKFSKEHDIIIFVSGKKAPMVKRFMAFAKSPMNAAIFVENEEEVDNSWFKPEDKVGIAGATSTPLWLMEKVRDYINGIFEAQLA